MANCSTLEKMFHEKGAQNNGRKNRVKSFFNKKNVPRRKKCSTTCKILAKPGQLLQITCVRRAGPGRCK